MERVAIVGYTDVIAWLMRARAADRGRGRTSCEIAPEKLRLD